MTQKYYKEIPIPDQLKIESQYCENAGARKVGFGVFQPKNCFLAKSYNDLYRPIQELEVRNDDVWVCSLARTGTTWLQEMVWLIANDCNFEGAKTVNLDQRFPWLEKSMLRPSGPMSSIEIVNQFKSPRFIKTHLPFNLLPTQIQSGDKQPKVLYVTRNPGDACVSFYHQLISIGGYMGTIDDLVDWFINDQVMFAPFWTHVQEYWGQREKANFLFVTYESMKKDLKSVITQVAEFLSKTLTPTNMEKLLDHLSFDSMKVNPAVNEVELRTKVAKFYNRDQSNAEDCTCIRKGMVGAWENEMSKESILKMKTWIEKNQIPGIWD